MTSIPARRIISQRVRLALAAPGSVRLPRRLVERRLPTNRSPLCSPPGKSLSKPGTASAARIPLEAWRQTRESRDRWELRHLAAGASDVLPEQYGAKLGERLRRRILRRADEGLPLSAPSPEGAPRGVLGTSAEGTVGLAQRPLDYGGTVERNSRVS